MTLSGSANLMVVRCLAAGQSKSCWARSVKVAHSSIASNYGDMLCRCAHWCCRAASLVHPRATGAPYTYCSVSVCEMSSSEQLEF
eukprot:3421943-Amphidinium_carterae.1